MSGYTDQFGGSTLTAAQVAYRAVTLEENALLFWPQFAGQDNVLSRIMNITATASGLSMALPDAREASPGEDVMFMNSGSFSVLITTKNGTPVANVEPGARRYLILTDNTTEDGVWDSTLFGVGTGSLDIAAAAGPGLRAAGTVLEVAFAVAPFAASPRAVGEADRDKVLIWTGGTGIVNLGLSSGLPAFSFEIRNQGTGTLTLTPTGGELIDGVASVILNNNESCWVHSSGSGWFTIGRGRNAQFNFTQLNKVVTGGTVVETLTEAANVVQTFTGALTSNVDVVLPAVVQVYYISNQTTGAFNFRLKNPGSGGSTVSLPQGQNAVIFSDGTNVVNAATTVAGLGAFNFGAGTVGAPALAVGATNNGWFAPTATSLAYSSNGVQTVLMDASGLYVTLAGNAKIGATSTGGTAIALLTRPAGAAGLVQVNTGANARWTFGADGGAESGANAGSNWALTRYNDAGAAIDNPVVVNRATGAVAVAGALNVAGVLTAASIKDVSQVGSLITFTDDGTISHPGCIKMNGALLSRAAYPDLFAYATATGLVSEATWAAGYWGRYSVGDGSTTFRIPDGRGMFFRQLDESRGYDVGRLWGLFQDQANVNHGHGVNDPTHAHGVYDPAHTHGGITDAQGVHQHLYTGWTTGFVANAGVQRTTYDPQTAATDAAGNHAHNLSINASGTGIGIYGAGTGISIQANGASDGHPRNLAYPVYIRY